MGVLEQRPDEENERTSYLIQVANATDEQAIVFPVARITSCGTLSVQVLQAVRSEDDGQKKAIYGSPDPAFLIKKGISTAFTLLSLLASQPGCFATKDWLSEKLGHFHTTEDETELDDEGEGLKRVDNVVSRLRFLLYPARAQESLEEQSLRRKLVVYRRASEESGPGYQLGLSFLWLDVVHIEAHVERARKLEQFGTDGFAEWQAAYELAMGGRFLAAESYSDWAEWRRRDVEKHLWECVQALWHRWSERGEVGEKESIRILRDYWHSHMCNEDALRPLLELLGKSECFGEANSYYNQLCTILAAEGKQPDRRTRDIIDFLQALQIQRKSNTFFLPYTFKKYSATGNEVISTGSDLLKSSPDPIDGNSLTIDWGEAPSTEHFYGREQELAVLTAWIQIQHCRLITVCGMGGVGKTSLVARLVDTEKKTFEYVFWRSLQQAPSLRNILGECLAFLCQQKQTYLPEDNDAMIALFIQQLRTSRCLIVFDNYETVMDGGFDAGEYRKSYEDYGRLIQRVGEVQHQSCLLITSREKMKELVRLEGKTSLTQTLMLQGIGLEEAKVLLQENGLSGSDETCLHLLHRYAGNPLALKLVAEPIIAFFHADIANFLQEDQAILNDINDIIAQQFNRLSERERIVLYWLAIEREPVAPTTLWENDSRLSLTSKRDLLDVLLSLRHRSFIEMNEQQFITLQPVVMEYVTDHLVSEFAAEIVTGNLHWLSLHALLKAQAREYLRVTQTHLILTPLSERLLLSLGREGVEKQCRALLSLLHHSPTLQKGYAAGNLLNLLLFMQYDLQGYDFSHLALRQAFLQGMHLSDVDFAHAEFSSARFTDTFGSILSVAFHPNGSTLAAGTTSNYIRFWDMPDGTASLTLQGHTAWVRCVAFSPDGRFLASGSDDQTVRFWDLKQNRCLHVFSGHTAWIRSLAFSPDGHYLVSCSEDRTIRLWNTQTGECVVCFQGHTSRVRSVALNRDGSLLASGSDDQTIRVWDIVSGDCLHILRGHVGAVRTIVFHPHERLLASSGDDQTIFVWDIESEQRILTLQGHTECIRTLAFHPDGKRLASGSDDQTVRLWNIETGRCVHTLHGHVQWIWSVAFNPNGAILASGSEDQTVRLWDIDTGYCIKTLQGYVNWVWSLEFSPDGHFLAGGCENQSVYLWRLSDGSLHDIFQGHQGRVRSVVFNNDSTTIFSGSEDRTIHRWVIADKQKNRILENFSVRVWFLALDSEGQILASSGEDSKIHLWDITSGICMKTLEGHTDRIRSIAWHPSARCIASGSEDQTIRVWNTESGKLTCLLNGHIGRVWTVSFSPDGNVLASGGDDKILRFWDVASGKQEKVLVGHSARIRSIAFSNDGSLLASGSEDRTIRIWSVETGQCLAVLTKHTGRVMSVAFHPQLSLLASSSDDGTVRLWDTQAFTCTHVFSLRKPYEHMNITAAKGLTNTQRENLKLLGAIEIG